MDDDVVSTEQARGLHDALGRAEIDLGQLWLYYFGLGGEADELEVDAYLHHSMVLPRLQRDLLAHAANELIDVLPPPRAPYAEDLGKAYRPRADPD